MGVSPTPGPAPTPSFNLDGGTEHSDDSEQPAVPPDVPTISSAIAPPSSCSSSLPSDTDASDVSSFPSLEDNPNLGPSLDHSYHLLFNHEDLTQLSDSELDSLIPENSLHYGNISSRRSQLFIISILVNGCLVKAMVDTGYTGVLLLDPKTAERSSVSEKIVKVADHVVKGGKAKIHQNLIVGDQRVVQVTQGTSCSLDVGGFVSSAVPWIMPLGDKFDAVLGLDFFRHLNKLCKSDVSFNFEKHYFKFTLKPTSKSSARTIKVSSAQPALNTMFAPSFSKKFLRTQVTRPSQDLPVGTRILRIDEFLNIIQTHYGDDFLVHDKCSDPGGTSSTSTATSSASCNAAHSDLSHSDSPLPSASSSNSQPASERGEKKIIDDDDLDGSRLVADAVASADRDNWKQPVKNPFWEPREPSPSDDFSDPSFMDRVEVRQNDVATLERREQEVGVKFIETLKQNGQVFRDDVPTRLIPDRGQWNGVLEFKQPEDARHPICKKPYRLSPDETRAAAVLLRDLLLRGTIRPSRSPWGTPIFLVPKADGGWRMCCDYRDLNAKLVHEAYSIPAADQLFDQLGDAQFFSSHDCTWGYHQLRWSEDSIPKTAIRTHLGTFEFLVVNFGSTSAPAQWTRLMESILRPYLGRFVIIFLDDMCIYSKTAEDHVKHLNMVYRLLAKNSIFLRFGKCFFFNRRFKFLGWIIEDGKLQADPEKVKVLEEWPLPTSKQEVRSFTGFCNFYRRLIPDFAKRVAPLHDLQRDVIPDSAAEFQSQQCWTDVHSSAFEDLRKALCSDPVVHIANPSLPYILDTDASQVAVGGILSQKDPSTGKIHVVEYYSRRLSAAQRNYAPGKLELLALIVTLEHWRHYLKGAPRGLTIITDHEPLLAIRKTKNPSRMLLRWLNFLEQFNFVVQYRKGKENPADPMSRPPESHPVLQRSGIEVTDDDTLADDASPDLSNALFQFAFDTVAHGSPVDDDFLDDLLSDVTLRRLRDATAEDGLFKSVLAKTRDYRSKFKIVDGLLWHTQTSNSLYIPTALSDLRLAIFKAHHGHVTAGHFGIKRTTAKIRQNYWWPGMGKDIAEWISLCSVCLLTKRKTVGSTVALPHRVPAAPWDVVFMDEVSGLVPSNGFDAIWVFMDQLSKMVHFVPVVKLGLDSPELAKLFFRNIFRLHGLPRVIISDRDTRINDDFWLNLFRAAGVHSNMSTPFHPQTDSSGEAAVKICIDLCRSFVNSNRDDWADLLPALEFAYNSTPGISGHSPFEINGLQQPRSAQSRLIDALLLRPVASERAEMGINLLKRYSQVILDARRALQQQSREIAQPTKTVTHTRRQVVFQVGDRVLLKRQWAGTSFPQDKMAPLYVGPFRISRVLGPKSYELDLPASMRVSRSQHVDNLWKPDQRMHFPPSDLLEARPPEEPTARISPEPLVFTRLFYEIDDDGIYELYVEIESFSRKFSLHELMVRQHFDEISNALRDQFRSLVSGYPFFLGRHIVQRSWGPEFPGIVSAYDPNDPARAFQLEFQDCGFSYWAPRTDFTVKRNPPIAEAHSLSLASHQVRPRRRPLRALEICCGGKSFTRQILKMFPNAEVYTLDIDPRYSPDFLNDVRVWDYLAHFPPGYFDIIWCSPPCTEYSPAKGGHPRDLETADSIVMGVLELLAIAAPRVWILENPHTMLYKRPFMLPLEKLRHSCSFCKYRFKYKKPTDLWTNLPALRLLNCDITPCPAQASFGSHPRTSQQGPSHSTPGVPRAQANFIPPRLLRYLIDSAVTFLKDCSDVQITWT